MNTNNTNKKDEQAVQPTLDPMFDEMIDAESEPETPNEGVAMTVFSSTPTFDMSDIMPPVLRLAQGLTPEVQDGSAKPGQWLLTGFDPVDTVHIVPLLFARRREYREDGAEIMCVSDDGITGVGDPGGDCRTCVMNQWAGERGSRKPPQCTFIYSYVVYVAEFDTTALLNFKRTSVGIGKMLNSLIARTGMGRTAVELISKKNQGKRGSYYSPQIVPIKDQAQVEDLVRRASVVI